MKFDKNPFLIKFDGNEYLVGEGQPMFTVKFNKEIPIKDLMTSTSIALSEAYMKGELEIEGDLYNALNCFLGQLGDFKTDESLLKNLIFTSTTKKNQKKEVTSHYDIGNAFYKFWLDDTMSYSCAYFQNYNITLTEAQNSKLDRTQKKYI